MDSRGCSTPSTSGVLCVQSKIIVCQKCGDQGFPELLLHCDSCRMAALHLYCLDIVGVVFDGRNVTLICEDCDLSRRSSLIVDKKALDHPKPRKLKNCLEHGTNCDDSKYVDSNGERSRGKASSFEDFAKSSAPNSSAERNKCADQQFMHKHADANNLKQDGLNKLNSAVPSAAGSKNENCSLSLPSYGKSNGTNARKRRLILSYSDEEYSEYNDKDLMTATKSIEEVCNSVGINRSACERVEKDSVLSNNPENLPLPIQLTRQGNPLDRKGSDGIQQFGSAFKNNMSTDMKSKNAEELGKLQGTTAALPVQQYNVRHPQNNLEGQITDTYNKPNEIAGRQYQDVCLNRRETKKTSVVPSSCGLKGKLQHTFDQGDLPEVQSKCVMENESNDMVKLEADADRTRFSHFLSNNQAANITTVQPTTPNIWRGWFHVGNREFGPVDAHLSTKACRRVWYTSESLVPILHLDKFSRSTACPKAFNTTAPSVEDIGLFFFPSELRPNPDLEELQHEVVGEDLVLSFSHEEYKLLIFPSTRLLPEDFRRFQGRTYLWGVFCGRKRGRYRIAEKEDCMVPTCKLAKMANTVEDKAMDYGSPRKKYLEGQEPAAPATYKVMTKSSSIQDVNCHSKGARNKCAETANLQTERLPVSINMRSNATGEDERSEEQQKRQPKMIEPSGYRVTSLAHNGTKYVDSDIEEGEIVESEECNSMEAVVGLKA